MSGIAVWRDGAADGPTNMAADECLAATAAERGGLVIRLYEWQTTTISLGAFQPIAAAEECNAIAGLPVVRRPSGGGAIVHGTDLTYAAAVPQGHPWATTPRVFYDAFHDAMVDVLRRRGVAARLAAPAAELEGEFFCFARRAGGDVVVDTGPPDRGSRGVKVMGSAQRRLAAAVLQHGSLLLRTNEEVGPDGRHPGLLGMPGTAWAGNGGWEDCVDEWLRMIAKSLGEPITEPGGAFLASHPTGLDAARERFAADRWKCRR